MDIYKYRWHITTLLLSFLSWTVTFFTWESSCWHCYQVHTFLFIERPIDDKINWIYRWTTKCKIAIELCETKGPPNELRSKWCLRNRCADISKYAFLAYSWRHCFNSFKTLLHHVNLSISVLYLRFLISYVSVLQTCFCNQINAIHPFVHIQAYLVSDQFPER